jgi:DNA invertase Pin-like site-specific DNA recombinase
MRVSPSITGESRMGPLALLVVCYSYIRFSHPNQAKGASLKRQLDKSRAYATRRGWTMDETLNLADKGISAFRGKNKNTGALSAFLGAVKTGRVQPGSALIIENLDRLSREEMDEAYELFRSILKAGITIITLDPEREYTKECLKSLTGVIEALIIMERAHEESVMKSKRISDNWERKRANAATRPILNAYPRWVKVVNGKFALIPERAEVIRRIFNMVLDGHGGNQIIRILNGEGIPSQDGKSCWDVSYIGRLLRDRKILGEYQPKTRGEGWKREKTGQPVPNYYPRVIEDEIWYRVQAMVNGRKKLSGRKGKSVANLFSGLLHEARDGCTMRIKNGNYLVSTGAMVGKQGSKYVTFDYALLEFAFLAFVKELRLDTPDVGRLDRELQAAQGELSDADDRIAKVQRAFDDNPDLDSLLPILKAQQARKVRLRETIERLTAQREQDTNKDLGQLQDLIGQYEAAIQSGETADFREQLRNKIRALVSEMWMLVEGRTGRGVKSQRKATVQIFFRSGGWRYLFVQAGVEGWMASLTAGDDDKGALDLRHWRHQPQESC